MNNQRNYDRKKQLWIKAELCYRATEKHASTKCIKVVVLGVEHSNVMGAYDERCLQMDADWAVQDVVYD